MRWWLRVGLFYVAFIALTEVGYTFSFAPWVGLGVFWPAVGLSLATLTSTPRRDWPPYLVAIFVGAMVLSFGKGFPLPVCLTWAFANCLQPVTGALALRRLVGPRISLGKPNHELALLLVAALNPALAAAIGSGAAAYWLGVHAFTAYWVTWWFGDALGVIVMTPFVLAWFEESSPRLRPREWVELLFLVALVAAIAHWSFDGDARVSGSRLVAFAFFPLMLWSALKFELRGATAAALALNVIATAHTSRGHGPFVLFGTSPIERIASLQVYLSFVTLSTLAFAGALQARRRVEVARQFLGSSSDELAQSIDYATTVQQIARLLVPSFADFCIIDVLDDEPKGAAIRRIAVTHADPEKQAIGEELQRERPHWRLHDPVVEVMRTGRSIVFAEIPETKDGAVDPLHALGATTAMIVPLVARGKTVGVVSVGSCRPHQRYSEEDLALAEQLARRCGVAIENARLYRAAQVAIRQRDEFLEVASHELRTPLASLALILRALRAHAGPGKPAELVGRAQRQSQRLNRLVEEVMNASAIDTGQLPLEIEDVDFEELVREVVARFELDLVAAHCPITVRSDARLIGRWDRSRLDEIVTNLLANATKFGAGKPIEVVLGCERGIARLAVTDHGVGIDPSRQATIFERFERGGVSTRNYGGLGLGLYVSRRIAEALGGSIRVESEPGAGATFIVELPVAGPAPKRKAS